MVTLTENMAVATSHEGATQENISELLAELIGSVDACDPSAIDLLDKILASVSPDGNVASNLSAPRELLDNFDFAGAAPLLEAIDLQAG